jgi:DMSO/TMAO reductase YedYZ molybdopterin-dependent catalytic subunit
MEEESKIRRKLPVHPLRGNETDRQARILRVDGLVRNRLALSLADLQRLPQEQLKDDFTCLEGWSVPKVSWSGVSLKSVLSLAEPRPEARYVQASAGNFTLPLSLERAEQALLAIRLYEGPVPLEHGGPVRLVVPGGECFTSIKWLEHLELFAEPGENTAEKIRAKRLPAEQPHKSSGGKNSPA